MIHAKEDKDRMVMETEFIVRGGFSPQHRAMEVTCTADVSAMSV